MSIRVIAGSAKGKQLKLVPGDSTRPIMDRVKEALFNIIGRNIYDAVVCDLFAGTGSVGIEALSRGASHAWFYDLDRKAIETIHTNLALTKLADKASVRRADAFALLKQPPAAQFTLIYVAPPQYKGMWSKILPLLDQEAAWTPEGTTVITQIDPSEHQSLALKRLHLYDERKYGNTLLLFYEAAPQTTEDGQAE